MVSLLADDVIFMVPGKEPFGKEAFVARFREMKGVKIGQKAGFRYRYVFAPSRGD